MYSLRRLQRGQEVDWTVLGPLVGAVVLSVVNELLWARFPEYYLAIVGVLILLAVLYMPRGIVNLAM